MITARKRFNKKFIREVNTLAMYLGLEDTTSARQQRNGTLEYKDMEFGFDEEATGYEVYYTLYPNGYIRRRIKYSGREYSNEQIYQLNRVEHITQDMRYTPAGKEWGITEIKTKRMVMASPPEQLGILFTAVRNYRWTALSRALSRNF